MKYKFKNGGIVKLQNAGTIPENNIPIKFDKPLKFSEIPTKNRISIIDNYSPKYNYIIEGDKMYYSVKGRDYWVDISDNNIARKNLFNFIGNKYDFKGYEDDEKDLWQRVNSDDFDYLKYKTDLNNQLNNAPKVNENKYVVEMPSKSTWAHNINDSSPTVKSISKPVPNPQVDVPIMLYNKLVNKIKNSNNENISGLYNVYEKEGLSGLANTIKQGLSRKFDKTFMDNEETPVLSPPNFSMNDSEYDILPQSFTGDTLRYKKGVLPREYFIPESIDMTSHLFGTRNRGDLTELNTEGAVVTAFNPFVTYDKSKVFDNATYMGIDSNGNFKVGQGSDFGPGDVLTKTFSNKVYDFDKGDGLSYNFQNDSKHGNSNQHIALVNVEDEKTGEIKKSGALNILVGKNDSSGSTYGSITGGRVLVRVGNELRLLSGSLQQVESEFEAMKKRQHADYGIFYTLDNGSYNKALRTFDKTLKKGDLANYDNKNVSGGNFIYILPEQKQDKFPQDTVLTPNIRTENDESYKKGHPLTNSNKGVVLHYTAFSDGNDLSNVTNHFLNPKSEASAHLVIAPNGNRRVFADPSKVTFHAGYSTWNGVDDVNDFMHGIEFQTPGPNTPLTKEQVDSAVEYLKKYIREYNIPLENITTHEVVRQNWLNSHTPAEIRKHKVQPKSDLSPSQYTQIIDALKQSVYYKKQQGGIIKGQSGLENIPTKKVEPKESFIDRLRKRWAEMRNETKRPNAFGKFVITKEETKVVDDGGKIA